MNDGFNEAVGYYRRKLKHTLAVDRIEPIRASMRPSDITDGNARGDPAADATRASMRPSDITDGNP